MSVGQADRATVRYAIVARELLVPAPRHRVRAAAARLLPERAAVGQPLRDPNNFANETLIFICNECVAKFAGWFARRATEAPP